MVMGWRCTYLAGVSDSSVDCIVWSSKEVVDVIVDIFGTSANAVAGHGGWCEAADVACVSSYEYVVEGLISEDSVVASDADYTVVYSHICG